MPTDLEKRYPFLYRYFEALPEVGKFRFYNTGWMNEVVMNRLEGSMSDSEYEFRQLWHEEAGRVYKCGPTGKSFSINSSVILILKN